MVIIKTGGKDHWERLQFSVPLPAGAGITNGSNTNLIKPGHYIDSHATLVNGSTTNVKTGIGGIFVIANGGGVFVSYGLFVRDISVQIGKLVDPGGGTVFVEVVVHLRDGPS